MERPVARIYAPVSTFTITLDKAILSEAVPEIVMMPETTAPFAGLVMVTEGGINSLFTTIDIAEKPEL